MADISVENLIPEMEAYKLYLSSQEHGKNARALSNVKEDYKRGIAERAAQILNAEDWTSNEIGTGIIGERVFKAVDRNFNLVGRFQVRLFSSKIKEKNEAAEKVLFDLYHDHKEQECFEQICKLFGRKYDLVSYLYFILDSGRYLPLRSSIFDGVFTKIGIDLQTAGMCSWQNYQKYLSTVAEVRDAMKDYYHQEEVDLLDAHHSCGRLHLMSWINTRKRKYRLKCL